jgi:(+)-beta-caryophyllene/(+)-caryolan-1-ol synthase
MTDIRNAGGGGEPRSPFPPRVSRYAAEAEQEVRRYLRRYGLLRSPEAADYYDGSRLGYLIAQVYPDAIRERLMVVTDWFGTWTVFDDQLEKVPDSRDPAGVDVVASVMLGWLPLPEQRFSLAGITTPFRPAFADVWARMRQASSPAWQARFLEHTRQYLAGCRWEADNRHRGTVPELEPYVEGRQRFGGIRMAMDLSEFANGYELGPDMYADPLVQELLQLLGDITLWGNDLFSVRVDEEEGNVSNLLFVLQRRHRCDLARAAERTYAMIDERLRYLAHLEQRLPDWFAARGLDQVQRRDVHRFVEGVHTWISGNINWSRENARYRTGQPRVSGSQPNFLLALLPDLPDLPDLTGCSSAS